MRPFCYAIVVISGLLGKLSYFFLNRPILCFVRSCDDVCIIKYVFNLYRVVLVKVLLLVTFCLFWWYLFRVELLIAVLTSWPLSVRQSVRLSVSWSDHRIR